MSQVISLPAVTVTLTGAGVPSNTLGANGYLYLDTATNFLYVKKNDVWSGISGSRTEYVYNTGTWDADDTTHFATGSSGAATAGALGTLRTKRVRFSGAYKNLQLQVSLNQTQWFDIHNFHDGSGNWHMPIMRSDGNLNYSSGTFLSPVSGSTTDVDVKFCRYLSIANDDVPIVNWPSTWYWRVKGEV